MFKGVEQREGLTLQWSGRRVRELRRLHRRMVSEPTFGGELGEGKAGRGWEEKGMRVFHIERTTWPNVRTPHGILQVKMGSLSKDLW